MINVMWFMSMSVDKLYVTGSLVFIMTEVWMVTMDLVQEVIVDWLIWLVISLALIFTGLFKSITKVG